ncbi:doubled CXXCH domain-containing protein [Malonomonas rubra DSM 5091]|uniref:Doubled CXXCH domain-containing protein n=1 Tax=Malonomonas rubra DSM 5091 TaxID=1122189 RepID=A0A1M6DTD8_MALRU|nr:cytochrome c3 family protein [Malonomonas rubra]SHI76433.1 doubled CXXCH domain-containing protein [Malonomonas rubra DSM 5091]
MHDKPLYCSGFFLLLLVFCLSVGLWAGFSGGGHDFRGRCEMCHLSMPTEDSPGKFVRDISYLCAECHTISTRNSHPIGMVPSMKVPESFALDWAGRMTCATCHDPHDVGLGDDLDFLRTDARGKDFCDLCHRGTLPLDGQRHIGSVGIAHGKSGIVESNTVYHQVLDQITLECLNCHDGVIASDASYKVMGGDALTYQRRGLSHPIGMDYRKAALLDRELRPVEMLAPEIALYDGKVGCASCHNPYSSKRRMLVVDNYASALCRECHIK